LVDAVSLLAGRVMESSSGGEIVVFDGWPTVELAMTTERAVDLTAALHPQESSPHRWHRVPASGGGQGAALPVRVVFMLPPSD
jgi:hypothetical protein